MLVLISELFVLVLVLTLPGGNSIDWNRLATVSLFVQWIVLTSSAYINLSRTFLKKQSIETAVAIIIAGVLAITLIFTLIAQWSINTDPVHTPLNWGQVLRNVLAALIITIMLLRYFFVQHTLNRQQHAVQSARLDSLQARIRPHFLFNSMNIIASLIQINPDKAEQAIEDLSDLFRSSLQDNDSVIPIHREIDLCKRYLRIEQQRLGERLELKWQIADLPESLTIPPFTLQPIIENAVYHGIQQLEYGGCITITISRINKNIQILVQNPMPLTEAISKGNQMALDNIRKRLEMLYGHEAYLDTEVQKENDSKHYLARINYPCKSDQYSIGSNAQ